MPWCDLTTGEDLELEESVQGRELSEGIHSAPFELLDPEGVAFNLSLEQFLSPVDGHVQEGECDAGDEEEAVESRAEEQGGEGEGVSALKLTRTRSVPARLPPPKTRSRCARWTPLRAFT